MKTQNKKDDSASLRNKANEIHKRKQAKSKQQLSEADNLKLIHELEVHQIELELQNEELLLARTAAQKASEKYTSLFDFAPSGYFTLSREGDIVELNLKGAQMLGKDRAQLINSAFGFFVSSDTKPAFLLSLEKIFAENSPCSCEVSLVNNGNTPMHVFLSGRLDEKKERCLVSAVDITERKLAEQALHESKNRFEELVDLLPEAVFETDIDLNLTYINQQAIELTGYSKEDFTKGMNGLDMLAPEDRSRAKAYFKMRMKGKSPGTLDYRAMKKDGSTYPILFHASPIISQGKISGVRGIIIDITKFRQAEEDIRQENARFQELVNTINSGVGIYKVINDGKSGKDYIIQDFNKAALKHEGLSKKEVVGRSLFDLRPNINEYGLIPVFREVWKTGKPAFYPATEYVDENYSNYYENKVFRLPNKEIIAVYDDVTERETAAIKIKESKDRFDLAMKASKDGVFDWNLLTNEIYYSPGWKSMLGYNEDELSNDISVWETLTSPDDLKKTWLMLNELFSKERDRFETEFKMKHKDGHWVNVLSRAEAIFDASGKAIRLVGTHVDISERILAKRALENSEQKLRELLNNLDAGVVLHAADTSIIDFNPRAAELLGLSNDQLKGKQAIDPEWYFIDENGIRISPESYPVNQIINTKKILKNLIIGVNRKKTKDVVWLLTSGVPIIDSHGKITEVITSFIDITKQKEAKEKAVIEKKKAQQYLDIADVMLVSLDSSGMVQLMNPKGCKILGYSEEEILGKSWYDNFLPERLRENVKGIPKRIYKGEIESVKYCEHEILTKSGQERLIAWHNAVLKDELGNVIGTLSSGEDITERKRAEQVQKVLYNISNRAIRTEDLKEFILSIRDELGPIIDTTNFFIALYDKETDTLSLPFFTDVKDKISSMPAGKTLTSLVIKSKKSLLVTRKQKHELAQAGEIELFGSDSEVWLGVPLKIEGETMGVIAVQSYTDKNAFNQSDQKILEFVSDQISISIDRKQAEENLLSALEKAQESDRLKSAFLAAMSHELRTPLNAIIGFSEIINENKPPLEEVFEFNETILSSGNHLLKIVEAIFDIALIESGETKLSLEDVRLNIILNEVIEISKIDREKANKNNLALNLINSLEEKDLLIKTDAAKLKQILINLLKNALKFTHSGEINFACRIDKSGDRQVILFLVEDTGIGVPKTKQDFIFDAFRQAEDSNTRKYGGVGLGLAIAKKLTLLLGGNIWLESEEGVGSKFYFTIPIEEEIKFSTIPILKENKYSRLKEKTILVVEDIEYSYEFLQIVLEKPGVNTLWAKNGKEAIAFCSENKDIDLVLMDINMPIMNGYDATREIRKTMPDLPIIAQTANAIAGDRERALASGCNDYISKPIKKTELLALLGKYL